MDPEFVCLQLEQLIDLRLAELRKGRVKSQHVLDLSRMYRRMGCGALLSGGDTESFFQALFLAADAYLQLLERKDLQPELADPYDLARGRAEPLLDALALGDADLVRRIDARAETQYREGMEYEEDYWFFTLLPRLLSPSVGEPEAREALGQLEQSLQGIVYPRYNALVALVRGDLAGFEQALESLTRAWEAQMERDADSELGNPYALATESGVFVEGIALVRVAQARGLPIREKYPLIPAAALSPPAAGARRVSLWNN